MASSTVLIVPGPFAGEPDAATVAAALGRGLQANSRWELDLCELNDEGDAGEVRELLAAANFDARMRAAHAVVVVEQRLDHAILRGSAAFEVATAARQAGVPCYAVAAHVELDPFEARILDLQLVVEAATSRALAAAGRLMARAI
jgi:Glycerate kinase family